MRDRPGIEFERQAVVSVEDIIFDVDRIQVARHARAAGGDERIERTRAEIGRQIIFRLFGIGPGVAVRAAEGERVREVVGRQQAERGIFLVALVDPRFTEERSEEHTSELQSLMRISYAVFCFKKKTQTPKT